MADRPSDEAVSVLQEIARLTNLYLGVGCCEEHDTANLNRLYDELGKFEDDSFQVLKNRTVDNEVRKQQSRKPRRQTPPAQREHWDSNSHSILVLQSLLRDASTPGEKFALRRVLRIMHAISDEVNPES